MSKKLVVFDLDGTLLDTSNDLLDCVNHCLLSVDLKPVVYEDLTFLVGQGARAMITRAFELNKANLTENELDRLFDLFIEYYTAHMPGSSTAYPGLMDAMERLSAAGYSHAVCTNKHEGMARKLLELLSLSDHFEAITGGNTYPYRKPDARHLLKTIELAGGVVEKSIMIGDSKNDIFAAQNAKVASIAVSFGFSDVPVQTLNPDVVINEYGELTVELADQLLHSR